MLNDAKRVIADPRWGLHFPGITEPVWAARLPSAVTKNHTQACASLGNEAFRFKPVTKRASRSKARILFSRASIYY